MGRDGTEKMKHLPPSHARVEAGVTELSQGALVLESGPAGRIVVFSAALSVTGVYVEG